MVAKNQSKPTKSTRGGVRPGSGRPRTRILSQTISKLVIDDLEKLAREDLMPAVRELLRGVYREETSKNGTQRIYQSPPSPQIAIYVTDRILGKLTEKHEISGAITTEVVHSDLKPRKPAVE